MRVPIDIATDETLAFIHEWLGNDRRRVLEVGAGEGHVAAALRGRGHEVVALDVDAESVAKACARGVDARVAGWPDFDDTPFEAVIFTRSLHHIEDLDGAVARAVDLIVPKGLVLVEDFAFSALDDATVGWFRDLLRVIGAAIDLDAPEDSMVSLVLAGRASESIIETDCHHDLHAWNRMQDALLDWFSPVDSRSAPYLYRYLVRIAPERAELTNVVTEVLAGEVAAAARQWIRPIGRRFVGRRRSG